MFDFPHQPASKDPISSPSIATGFTDRKKDPLTAVERILRHRAAAVKEDVSGDIALTEGISDFRGDKAKLDELLRNLIDAKVLSVSDANLLYEAKSSNLSMRKKKLQGQ